MAFLAHFLNTPITTMYEWTVNKINFWYTESESLFKKLQPKEKEE